MKKTFQPNNHKKQKDVKNYQHNSTYLCISGFLLLEVHL